MGKLTLFVVLIVLASYLAYWLYRSQGLLTGPALLSPSTSTPTTTTTTTTTTPPPPQPRSGGSSPPGPTDSPSLRRQLDEALGELQTQRGHLENLKQQKSELQNQLQLQVPQTAQEVHNNAAEIQELTENLEVQRLAERDVQWAAESAQLSEAQAIDAARAQLDEQIRALERAQRETQTQIQHWQIQFFDLTLRADQLTFLNNQLAQQTSELETLRAQKTQLPAAHWLDLQSIAQASQSERENLVSSEQEILARISSLREDIRRQQVSDEEAKLSLTRLEDQINLTEKIINDQTQQIENLRKTLEPQ